MTETRSSTEPGDGMTLGGGVDDRAPARDRRSVESPGLSAEQIVEIVHEVSCGPIRFAAWDRGEEVHIGVEGDSCRGEVEYSIGVDEFGTVGEVLEHLLSEAKRFLEEQFTYRGLEVEFSEARSDAEEGAG